MIAAVGVSPVTGLRRIHPPAATDGRLDGVRCWLIDLPAWAASQQQPSDLLAPGELARSRRFVHPEDRDRQVARWAAVRTILAGTLGCQPGEIEFTRSSVGKPGIIHPVTELEFSVAACGPMAMLAVDRQPVGVDLERVRVDLATPEAAAVFLTPGELSTWSALPSDERTEAFFRCWTRKEAWVKASGAGLGGGRVERCELCFRTVQGLVDFTPAAGHIAALAGWTGASQ